MPNSHPNPDRRRFLWWLAAAPMAAAASSLPLAQVLAADAPGRSDGATFPPTPDCGDDDEPTPSETAGPFFKPRSPLRGSLLEPGIHGTPIVIRGRVFSRHCRPVAGALLDFWHADADGEYDNVGFKLRGHQFTDAKGWYRLETVVPGLYPGRTRHVHVRVQAPRSRVLTTQLYFPGEPRNDEDGLFRSELLLRLKDDAARKLASFSFLLDVA